MWSKAGGTGRQRVYVKPVSFIQFCYELKTALNMNSILQKEWGGCVKIHLIFLTNEEIIVF